MHSAPQPTSRRRNRLIERSLHEEVALRLRALGLLFVAPPNGFYIPARTKEERDLAARLVRQMKASGGLTPGAPDIVFPAACLELKRPKTRDLFGSAAPAGRLSQAQLDFRARCIAADIPYESVDNWQDALPLIQEWQRLGLIGNRGVRSCDAQPAGP